jgi:error-prone DNA polymerase
MPYSNPPIPWSEFERRLSDSRRPGGPPVVADGGDSPAWSGKRHPYRAAPLIPPNHPTQPRSDTVPYAELHAHSNFSFLDGASSPEELLEEASRLGLDALALTDHDGFYGAVHLAEAAEQQPVRTIFGAELSLGLGAPQNGVPDPEARWCQGADAPRPTRRRRASRSTTRTRSPTASPAA